MKEETIDSWDKQTGKLRELTFNVFAVIIMHYCNVELHHVSRNELHDVGHNIINRKDATGGCHNNNRHD